MIADNEIFAALNGRDAKLEGAAPACGVVETRFHFDGFGAVDGRLEGRDAAGNSLFCAPTSALLGSLPCFTAQSLMATASGPVPVAGLGPGMRLLTRDNGPQELRWVGRRSFGWQALGLNPLLRPVRIAAGALGAGLPEREMIVSPNHRFLTGPGAADERLTMARDLLGRPGIGLAPLSRVEYWQLLFDRHELLLSDGCWSESFLPTPTAIAALDDDGRAALCSALPVRTLAGFAAARPFAEVVA